MYIKCNALNSLSVKFLIFLVGYVVERFVLKANHLSELIYLGCRYFSYIFPLFLAARARSQNFWTIGERRGFFSEKRGGIIALRAFAIVWSDERNEGPT